MTLGELKKELHASIEETNNEQVLLEVSQFLSHYKDRETPDLLHEDLPEFKKALATSISQADENDVYSYETTMEWLNERAWRTK